MYRPETWGLGDQGSSLNQGSPHHSSQAVLELLGPAPCKPGLLPSTLRAYTKVVYHSLSCPG